MTNFIKINKRNPELHSLGKGFFVFKSITKKIFKTFENIIELF